MSVSDAPKDGRGTKKPPPQQAFRINWRAASGDPQSTSVNPYPGLRSFNVNEAHIFRARSKQIKALRKAFAGASSAEKARHVIIVVGGSSSGKSSVVKAGLLADIHSLQMPDGRGNWYIAECRPVQSPMHELLSGLATMIVDAIFTELEHHGPKLPENVEKALERLGGAHIGDQLPGENLRASVTRRVRALLDEQLWSSRIQSNPAAMAPYLAFFVREALNRLDAHLHPFRGGPPRLLLSLDQFEEIFRCPDNAEKAGLFDLLRFIDQAEEQSAPELYLVASMRSEELHRCSELKGISEIVNRSLHLVELVSPDAVRQAIIEPARLTLQGYKFPFTSDPNWPYSKASVDAMVESYDAFASGKIDYRADALPLLQHLLRLLWEKSVSVWTDASDASSFEINSESLSKLPGWDEPRPNAAWKNRAPSEDVEEAQNRLARVLNRRADAVYERAIKAWCNAGSDSSDQTRALAQTVLKAALVSLVRQDDRRRLVREWQTLDEMLATSKAVERYIAESTEGAWPHGRAVKFEKPLAAALLEFENATLIERRADAGSRDDRKLPDKYTVYHESFIRNWLRYQNWVREAGKASATLQAIYMELRDPTTTLAPEEAVTAGREADLCAVVGYTDDGNKKKPDLLEPAASGHDAASQSGWASKGWMLTEISHVETPGAPFDAQGFLAKLHELRTRAVDIRKNKSELEAETARAKAEAAEAKAEAAEAKAQTEKKKVRSWSLIAALTSFVLTTAIALGLAYFYSSLNQQNEFRHRIYSLGLVGFEATETGPEGIRQIYQDRDLWLALNALDPTNKTYEWGEANDEHQSLREDMRIQIARRARQVLADLTYVGDQSNFVGGGEVKETKCLLKSLDEASTNGPGWPRGPDKIWYRIEDGTLLYKANEAEVFRPVFELDGIRPLSSVCISPESEALLLISGRNNQPRPVVALTQWNRASFRQESQWFLQNLPVRALQSWSSQADYANRPIDLMALEKTKFLRHETFVGFIVPVHRGNEPSKGSPQPEQPMGILWTNQSYTSAMVDQSVFNSLTKIEAACTQEEDGRRACIINTIQDGKQISVEYNQFTGQHPRCVNEAEYCTSRITIQSKNGKNIEFIYHGRRPNGLKMDENFLFVQGDDGVIRKFDLRLTTVKYLISLRWRHLACRTDDALGMLDSPGMGKDQQLYSQQGLPKYPDKQAAPGCLQR